MKEILLTQGRVALVDDEDYDYLIQWNWYVAYNGWHPYAVRWRLVSEPEGPNTVRMHREILKAPSGTMVDHIDGDGLNNQRNNLRLATHTQNMRNRRPKRGNRFRGVTKHKDGKWMIVVCGFETEEAAARARDQVVRDLHGEFAFLSFPEEART